MESIHLINAVHKKKNPPLKVPHPLTTTINKKKKRSYKRKLRYFTADNNDKIK